MPVKRLGRALLGRIYDVLGVGALASRAVRGGGSTRVNVRAGLVLALGTCLLRLLPLTRQLGSTDVLIILEEGRALLAAVG